MQTKIKKFIVPIFPYLLFITLTIIIFKPYIFNNKVPFPGNLLVSFYQPWASYTWQGYPSGPPNKPIGFDNLRIFFPLRQLTIEDLKSGKWPLWNPYDFSGNIQLATYQSAVFHPLGILFFLLPQIDAWSLIVVLEPFLAMIFMYLFLRELSLGEKASMFGAIGFGLSGFLIVMFEESFMVGYSALFLPLILLGIEKIYKNISPVYILYVVLGILCSILSGWFQLTLYVLLFAFSYALFLLLRTKSFKSFYIVCLAIICSLLITAVQILPAFEAYLYSARGSTDAKFLFDTYLVPWYHLITYIAPDFFGNPAAYNYFGKGFYYEKILYVSLPILLFGIYGACATFQKKSKSLFFTIAWIISLSLGFTLPTSWFFLYSLHLPIISTSLPSRIFFLSAFCICVLAAYGWEKYEKRASALWICLAACIVTAILAGGWIYIIDIKFFVPKAFAHTDLLLDILSKITISKRNLLLPTVFVATTIICGLIGLYKSFRTKLFYVILFIECVSSIYFANKYLYFSDRQFTFPNVPVIAALERTPGNDRVWSYGKAYIERNFLTYYHLQSPEGYDVFSLQRYGELLLAAQNQGRYNANIPRADALIRSGQNISEIIDDPFRLKVLSLLGVKYIVGPHTDIDQQNHSDLLKPIWSDKKFVIYQYKDALPRTFLADTYRVEKTNQNILSTLFNPSFDLSKTLVVEKQPKGFLLSSKVLQYITKITKYESEKITIDVHTNKNALLFLSDNYYPGWNAYVDNQPTAIYRTDYSFRSIIVPKGNHTVVFSYQPVSFYSGLTVSIISVIIFCCILLMMYYKRYVYLPGKRA